MHSMRSADSNEPTGLSLWKPIYFTFSGIHGHISGFADANGSDLTRY
jgi:hypothetical protein